MLRSSFMRAGLVLLIAIGLGRTAPAQTFPFTSGPIPLCDTSTFTADVSGVGWLITPNGWTWGSYLEDLVINITSDHPQTLEISLTSPEGTTLLLSAFNGAGGQNYTDTHFAYWGWADITTASAPFTGSYYPQGGTFDAFSGEYGDGTWTITVIDTACANGGVGPNGNWTPGWFSGGAGSGAFAFGFSSPPPPCYYDMGWQNAYTCAGGTVNVLAYFESNWGMGGGMTWTVYDGTGWNVVPDPTAVSAPGQYSVQGYDWNNCNYFGTFEVIASPSIALGPDQVVDQCSSAGPVDLTSLFDLSGVWPSWTLDGVAIASAGATAAAMPGTYQLIGSNAGGCNDTALVMLTIYPDPMLGPDQSVSFCPGSTVDLTTLYDTIGLSAIWTFGASSFPTPEAATMPGVYTLTAATVNGCTGTADVTLLAETSPTLGADLSNELCSNATLDLAALFNTTGLSTAWSISGVLVPDPTAIADPGDYQLVAANAAGCTDTAHVVVSMIASPSVGGDVAEAICASDVLDLTTVFITTGLSTAWSVNGAAVVDPAAVNTTGLYQLVATSVTGCMDSAYVDLVVSPDPVLGPDQVITGCEGMVIDLTTLYATGVNATSWTESGLPVADPASITTSGSYTLIATSAANCSATALVSVDLQASPGLGADQAASVCAGSSLDLTALVPAPGLTSAWTLNGVAVADPTVVDIAGAYHVVVTNASGCSDTAVVALVVNDNPVLGADLSFALCPWQTVDLATVLPVGGLDASYMFDGQPVPDPTAVSDSGAYFVSVIDANGCMDDALVMIDNLDCLCAADFTHDTKCMQDPALFTLLADSMIVSARWDFNGLAAVTNEIDPLVKFYSGGNVQVTLDATLSCGVVRVERMIYVEDCSDSCSVWIPSSFTPNDDAKNDTWSWKGECRPEDFSMEIFDRFGEMIFASSDPQDTWDGTYRGAASPDGVYVYRVGYRLPYQKRKEVMGSIVLLR